MKGKVVFIHFLSHLIFAFILVCSFSFAAYSKTSAKTAGASLSLRKLSQEFANLQKNKKTEASHRYDNLIKQCNQLASKSAYLPIKHRALLLAAQITQHLARIHKTDKQWQAASLAYMRLYQAPSSDSFADNALYQAALIELEERKKPEQAKKLLITSMQKGAASTSLKKSKRLLAQIKSSSFPAQAAPPKPSQGGPTALASSSSSPPSADTPDSIAPNFESVSNEKKHAPWRLRLVLDPGHGGSDSGAVGPKGTYEKHLTLDIAHCTKKVLKQEMPQVEVHMTRQSDTTLSLSQRTQFANQLKADLFISIHVNASLDPNTQGIETYYLNTTADRYSMRLAARENAMDEKETSNLQYILADLMVKSTLTSSLHLSQMVQLSLVTHVQEQWPATKDLGIKAGLLAVLFGSNAPACLVEIGFISNRQEEKRLNSQTYKMQVAQGIVRGIQRYAEEKYAAYGNS